MITFIYAVCVVCVCLSAKVYMWKSEDNLWELVLPFHLAGPRDGTYTVRRGSKSLYPISTEPSHQPKFSDF